ncbi:hypothetical protein [Nocardia carnea]|uniref:hypothetical protein n=1 Tax=Nocardia carnea TaxID=37328 RepID=UPI002454394D|nr:hypothetical protein [Nocardia carnea]
MREQQLSAPVRDGATPALIAWPALATTAAAYWLFTAGLARVRATTAGVANIRGA